MTAPAARPARMSSRKSPTTSVSSGATPIAAAACSTPSGAGLGDVAVVAGHHDVEVVHGERGEMAQRALDRAEPVAREHADCEPGPAQPPHQLLGAFVGRGGVGGGQLEPLQRERGGVARLAGGQRQDPLEDELVRRAAHFALDGREVEGAGMGERAVEVEEDGPAAGTAARRSRRRGRPRRSLGEGLDADIAPGRTRSWRRSTLDPLRLRKLCPALAVAPRHPGDSPGVRSPWGASGRGRPSLTATTNLRPGVHAQLAGQRHGRVAGQFDGAGGAQAEGPQRAAGPDLVPGG